MLVHIFRKTDLPSRANWVLRKSTMNCEVYITQCIENNFYVNDLLKSMSNEEDLIQLSSKLLTILSDCGFRLTKFTLNSINTLNHLPASKISPKIKKLDLIEHPVEPALGMLWDLKTDISPSARYKKYTKTQKEVF